MSLRDDAERVIDESRRQELLAKERLRLREVAELVGLSKTKVRDDVARGELAIVRVKCGTRWMFLVEATEARRYHSALFHAA